MPFTIPNIEASPTFDGQAVPDFTDWAALTAGESSTGVINGCGVTQHTGSDMNVAVAAGNIFVNGGASIAVAAVTSLAIGAASASDRRDIVTVNSSGTVSVTAGTACGTAGWTRNSSGLPPVKPSIPANSVLLAEVYVAATTTVITTAANIIDKTLIIGVAPIQVTTQSGTTYTLALTDANSEILASNASAITVTVPPNSGVAFPIGTVINLTQTGAGKPSFHTAGTPTINSPGALLGCRVEYSTISLLKTATDTWQLSGDLA